MATKKTKKMKNSRARGEAWSRKPTVMRGAIVIDCSTDLEVIRSLLSKCPESFEPSKVYLTELQRHVIDTKVRVSKVRQLHTTELFEACERILARVTARHSRLHFYLRRNNVTHLQYKDGGFFGRHQDYLSVKSNVLLEFTMLLCVGDPRAKSPVVGGETIIHGSDTSVAFDVRTPGKGVLFRKDLEHQGRRVTSGVKEILSLDVWGIPKRSRQVLCVTFAPPGPRVQGPRVQGPRVQGPRVQVVKQRQPMCEPFGRDAKARVSKTGQKAKSDAVSHTPCKTLLMQSTERIYAIPTHSVCGRVLENHVRRANAAATRAGVDLPRVIQYCCSSEIASYEEFATIVRICAGARITLAQLRQSRRVIKYFGPYDSNAMMVVDMSSRSHGHSRDDHSRDDHSRDDHSRDDHSRDDHSRDKKHTLTRVSKITTGSDGKRVGVDASRKTPPDMIICENRAKARVLSAAASALGSDYILFKLILVEGTVTASGDTCNPGTFTLELTPGLLSLGDFGQIVASRNFVSSAGLEQKTNALTSAQFLGGDVTYSSDLYVEELRPVEKERFTFTGFAYGTCRWGLSYEIANGDEFEILFGDPSRSRPVRFFDRSAAEKARRRGVEFSAIASEAQRRTRDLIQKQVLESTHFPQAIASLISHYAGCLKPPLYLRTEQGRAYFDGKQARAVEERLVRMRFIERIKEQLASIDFILPQSSQSMSAFLCNERLYTDLSYVEVSGLVNLSIFWSAE